MVPENGTGTGSRQHRPPAAVAAFAVAVLAGLLLAREYDYLLFHSIAEVFAVVIACGIFMISWNSRGFTDNSFLLFLGLCYPFVAALDFLHMLAYKGMGVFRAPGADLATQLWIAARYLEATILFAAPGAARSRIRPLLVVSVCAATTLLLVLSIFVFRIFPHCFEDGTGLTVFKRVSEYVICAILVGAAWHMRIRWRDFDPTVYRLLIASIAVTILSELAFTNYSDPYGFYNLLGHYLKIVSFWLVYKATIETVLRRPYQLLFRNLKRGEEALRAANLELEKYARTVSHDLRGPLAAILGATDSIAEILDGPGSEESFSHARELASFVERNVGDAVALTENLLVLARAGQQPVEVEDVDVGMVVDRVVDREAGAIARLGARVEVRTDLGRVRADPTHVLQLFGNLIRNSLAHGGRAGLTIGVERLPDVVPRFVVRDDGRGFPPGATEPLFESFQKSGGSGSGLGLSIVHRVVGLYGGTVEARTEGGAVVEFTLPDYRPDPSRSPSR